MDIERLIQVAQEHSKWKFGNDVLYKLCKDHPDHKSEDVVIAKIWLIGRAYSAAIERRKDKGSFSYEADVAPKIMESGLDEHLDRVRGFSKITEESIPIILEIV